MFFVKSSKFTKFITKNTKKDTAQKAAFFSNGFLWKKPVFWREEIWKGVVQVYIIEEMHFVRRSNLTTFMTWVVELGSLPLQPPKNTHLGSMGRLHIYLHEWMIFMVNFVCKCRYIYHRWITVGDDPILELWFRRPLRSSRMTFYFRFFGYCGGTVCNRWQSRWWFQIVFIFTPTWGNDPFWLIFFKGVETTNQQCFFYIKSKWSKEIKLKVFSKFFSDF